MLSAEGTGKNIEKAIENALFQLKAPREDVDIKIISEGGLFKKAKVEVSISPDAIEKYEKKAEIKKRIQEEEKTQIKEEKKAEKEIKKAEKKTEKEEVKALKEEEKQDGEREEKTLDPVEFLKGLFQTAGKTVEITTQEDENFITYVVDGEDLGDLIGHRGETFYAISRLFQIVVGKRGKRVLLDIGGFREKRKESLTALAYRLANKVVATGRYAKLDPMTPADRRIIHTALQDDKRVSTMSKGSEPHRYVMIFPQGEE